jgi:putative hemolysin
VSKEEFDHRKTGYALEGGHAGLKCERCHSPERIPVAARKGILMKDLKRTYLGLNRECTTCHQDEHRGQLGTACERCHTVARWKDVTRFDHSATKFRLTGAHEKTACQKCHLEAPGAGTSKPFVRYTGIAFAQCGACHKDPHRGAFTAPCSSCHNDVAWKPAHGTTVSFDHSKTKYPLAGKHDGVVCDKCHRTSDFKAPVAHEQCANCHKDVHGGQFAKRSDGGECGSCHTVEGWKASTYTAAAHAKSAYPLLGKHLAVTCDKCHLPAGAATKYMVSFAVCTDCHRDPHEGQFPKSKCEDCHTVDQFQPARFTLARHDQTRFPLQGAHRAVACSDCHTKTPTVPVAHVAYRFTDLSCTGCHRDPHLGQFQDSHCESCHNQQAWGDITKFDHSKTRFVLTGGHRGVACDRCHRVTPLSTGLKRAVFHSTPTACGGCHEDTHQGQFATAAQKPECNACHNDNLWKGATIDHDKTRFPLTGAHRPVGCRDCHKNQREVSGRMTLFYKPTPTECSGCHGPKRSN